MSHYTVRPVDEDVLNSLSSYKPLTRRLLALRGIQNPEQAERFLNPDWNRDTHDPFLMKDMRKAVEHILDTIKNKQTIAIWSDYDMDGIPGAALLYECFEKIGYKHVIHHTPHRNRDGFGLNKIGLEELKEKGASLVITVDCGIGDIDLVSHANSLGLRVIVTDHHQPHETLPGAVAILNPKQVDCTYPEKTLCGAGVAFKLVQGLLKEIRSSTKKFKGTVPKESWEKWLVDMAGMSTIADMVPLLGENRTLAHYGLIVLRKSRRAGMQALLREARVDQRHLSEDDVGFTIAPRINAASRMGHASDAFELLTTKNEERADVLAKELDIINKERKTVVAVMKREIKRRLAKLGEPKDVIVLGNPDWKPSLLGLVAGGLAEDYNRPVFLWGREEGIVIRGSCRSEGISDVFEVMHEASEAFLEYGGHSYSGGFSVSDGHIHTLEQALIEAHRKVSKKGIGGSLFVDAELTLPEINWGTHREISALGPFGEGNKKPVFIIHDVLIDVLRQFGKSSEHLEITTKSDDGKRIKAIAFFSKPDTFRTPPEEGKKISIVAHFEESHFRNKHELRLRIIDVA